MIGQARKVLSAWEPGDHLLMVGDPTLCAICASIVGEYCDQLDVLSWDRNTFQYMAQSWDFSLMPEEDGDYESVMADD